MIRTLDEIIKKRKEAYESFDAFCNRRSDLILKRAHLESDSDEYKKLSKELSSIHNKLGDLVGIKKALDYLVNYDSDLDVSASYVVKYDSGDVYRKSIDK